MSSKCPFRITQFVLSVSQSQTSKPREHDDASRRPSGCQAREPTSSGCGKTCVTRFSAKLHTTTLDAAAMANRSPFGEKETDLHSPNGSISASLPSARLKSRTPFVSPATAIVRVSGLKSNDVSLRICLSELHWKTRSPLVRFQTAISPLPKRAPTSCASGLKRTPPVWSDGPLHSRSFSPLEVRKTETSPRDPPSA